MSYKSAMPDSERYTYDYFFLEYVCRLCWGRDGVIELTSFSPKSIENDATIAEKIQECIGIDVTTLTHPKKICSKCLNEIDVFTEFKRFCLESNKKLLGILQPEAKVLEKQEESSTGDPIVKEESNIEFSNFDLDNSIDDFFEDLPLSCEIGGKVEKTKKERKKRPATYCNMCHVNLETNEVFVEHNLEVHGIEENGHCKCFGCEKKFKNLKKRLRHEVEICKELKLGYKCSICGRYLAKRRLFEVHISSHRENKDLELPEDIFKCNKCVESFDGSESLREHMLTHYKKEKIEKTRTYICDVCGRVFNRRDYLYKHKLTHTGNKLHKCPHCAYTAIQRASLTVHIRKHTGERPYACDLCPHRCITSSNLSAHRRRHFGVKAFECKLCDKKFGYKLSLEEHMSAVHERSDTHNCMHCGSTYSRFRGLRRHLLAKHGKRVKKLKDDFVEVQNEKNKTVDSAPVEPIGGAFDLPYRPFEETQA